VRTPLIDTPQYQRNGNRLTIESCSTRRRIYMFLSFRYATGTGIRIYVYQTRRATYFPSHYAMRQFRSDTVHCRDHSNFEIESPILYIIEPKSTTEDLHPDSNRIFIHRPALTPVMRVVRALLMCHGNQTCLLIAEIGYENRRANHVRSISLGLAYDQPKSSLSVWRRYY